MNDTWLLYDGECPFCRSFVRLIRLKEAIGPVRLVNARGGGPEAQELRRRGLDINEGMALHYEGEIYHGADCVHKLTMMTTENRLFNRFNAWMFRSPTRANRLYPILKAGRNATLRLIGRRLIGE